MTFRSRAGAEPGPAAGPPDSWSSDPYAPPSPPTPVSPGAHTVLLWVHPLPGCTSETHCISQREGGADPAVPRAPGEHLGRQTTAALGSTGAQPCAPEWQKSCARPRCSLPGERPQGKFPAGRRSNACTQRPLGSSAGEDLGAGTLLSLPTCSLRVDAGEGNKLLSCLGCP